MEHRFRCNPSSDDLDLSAFGITKGIETAVIGDGKMCLLIRYRDADFDFDVDVFNRVLWYGVFLACRWQTVFSNGNTIC